MPRRSTVNKSSRKLENEEDITKTLGKMGKMIESGVGEITVEELAQLESTLSKEESEKFHAVVHELLNSGKATFRPNVTKIHDKGLIISSKFMVRMATPEKPNPVHPLILRNRYA